MTCVCSLRAHKHYILTVTIDVIFTHQPIVRNHPRCVSAYDGKLIESGPDSVASFAYDLQPLDRMQVLFRL